MQTCFHALQTFSLSFISVLSHSCNFFFFFLFCLWHSLSLAFFDGLLFRVFVCSYVIVCLCVVGSAASKMHFFDSRRADARQDCVLKCGNASSPYGICSTPENCGTAPGSIGCGCNCPACPSCVVSKNPLFTKACAANVSNLFSSLIKKLVYFFLHFPVFPCFPKGVADFGRFVFD